VGYVVIGSLCANYVGTPDATTTLRVAFQKSIELICTYTGHDQDGAFLEWYKDGIAVSVEKHGHYVVRTTPTQSSLMIKTFGKNDCH
jgi:hypothetical protein